jgi:hypothetical protein
LKKGIKELVEIIAAIWVNASGNPVERTKLANIFCSHPLLEVLVLISLLMPLYSKINLLRMLSPTLVLSLLEVAHFPPLSFRVDLMLYFQCFVGL